MPYSAIVTTKKSPFTDCITETIATEKTSELNNVLRRDHEIRVWQETQRNQPRHPHQRRPHQHHPTYSDHQHNRQASLRDSESSPRLNQTHTSHLGSQNDEHQPVQARAFSRDRTNNSSTQNDRRALESPKQTFRLVENIENVHEALRRHRDHLRAQLDNMTAAGRLASSATQVQSSGNDTKAMLKEVISVSNGPPLPPAPLPQGC